MAREVLLDGETISEAQARAEAEARERGLIWVHPYDDPHVIAGQGTIALEMLEEVPDLDVLVIPIGGGGLISGIATAAKAIKPAIEIVGVESALYPSFWNAIRGEQRPLGGATLAEGIAVKNVGALTLPIVRALVSDIVLVDEECIERAVNAYLTLQKAMAEGAGAAGLAAMLAEPARFAGKRVGLVLCGGNIDPRILASIMVRELERDNRIVSFRLTIADRPGLLGQIATTLGRLGANILEVDHRRLFLDVPAKGARLDVTVEIRDAAHAEEILATLKAEGFAPVRIATGDAMEYGGIGQVSHADRYERAEEYLTVVKGLWDSWTDDAVLDDRRCRSLRGPEPGEGDRSRWPALQSEGPAQPAAFAARPTGVRAGRIVGHRKAICSAPRRSGVHRASGKEDGQGVLR